MVCVCLLVCVFYLLNSAAVFSFCFFTFGMVSVVFRDRVVLVDWFVMLWCLNLVLILFYAMIGLCRCVDNLSTDEVISALIQFGCQVVIYDV